MESSQYMLQQDFVEEMNSYPIHTMPVQEQLQYRQQLQMPEKNLETSETQQQILAENVNTDEEQMEEEVVIDVQDFKMRYQEAANTVREEIKQIITIQVSFLNSN